MKLVLGKRGKWGIRGAPYAIKTWDKLPEKVKRLVHLMVVMLPPGEKYEMSAEIGVEIDVWGVVEGGRRRVTDFSLDTVKNRHSNTDSFMLFSIALPEAPMYEIKIANKWVEQWIREEGIMQGEQDGRQPG